MNVRNTVEACLVVSSGQEGEACALFHWCEVIARSCVYHDGGD